VSREQQGGSANQSGSNPDCRLEDWSMFDEVRFLALKTGADAARGTQYVTIQTADLAWLLELIDALRAAPVRMANHTELN